MKIRICILITFLIMSIHWVHAQDNDDHLNFLDKKGLYSVKFYPSFSEEQELIEDIVIKHANKYKNGEVEDEYTEKMIKIHDITSTTRQFIKHIIDELFFTPNYEREILNEIENSMDDTLKMHMFRNITSFMNIFEIKNSNDDNDLKMYILKRINRLIDSENFFQKTPISTSPEEISYVTSIIQKGLEKVNMHSERPIDCPSIKLIIKTCTKLLDKIRETMFNENRAADVETKTLNIPLILQEKTNWCWAAAGQMINDHYIENHFEFRNKEEQNKFRFKQKEFVLNTYQEDLNRTAEMKEIKKAFEKWYASRKDSQRTLENNLGKISKLDPKILVQEMIEFLRKDKPVLVIIRNLFETNKGGHCIVLKAYRKERGKIIFYFNDPSQVASVRAAEYNALHERVLQAKSIFFETPSLQAVWKSGIYLPLPL